MNRKISRVECIIVPHAGYVYSGQVAAHGYKVAFDFFQKFRNEKRIIVIILGPNHYGIGSGVALSEVSSWRTPLGDVNLAKDLGKLLVSTFQNNRFGRNRPFQRAFNRSAGAIHSGRRGSVDFEDLNFADFFDATGYGNYFGNQRRNKKTDRT